MGNYFVAIPTYKRAGNVETLQIFPEGVLFVNHEERHQYEDKHPGQRIIEAPEGTYGLTPKLNFILEYCEENGIKRMLKVDDDFTSMTCLLDGVTNKIKDKDHIDGVIERCFQMTEDAGTRFFSFAYPSDLRRYNPNKPFSLFASQKCGVYGMIIGDGFRFDERFVTKQDFDLTIRTLMDYSFYIIENRYIFYFKPTMGNPGGCSEYRNMELEEKMIDLLRKKFGDSMFKKSKAKRTQGMTIDIKNPF